MTSPGPIAFSIGSLDIMWYGVLIATAMVLAIIICCKRAPRHGMTTDNVLDLALWMIPIGVIGARLYYVVFNFYLYQGDFLSILNIRNGGLAIHGGILFGILAAYFVCRHYSISFICCLDLAAPAVALAQAIGRWGNFFNSEAYGTTTDLPWAIVVNGEHVHPTFLYESIWCFLLFLLLSYFDKNCRTFDGQIFCMYCILYSVERFFVEWLRTDSLMIGPFKQAQVLSITAIIICCILYSYFRKNYPLNK